MRDRARDIPGMDMEHGMPRMPRMPPRLPRAGQRAGGAVSRHSASARRGMDDDEDEGEHEVDHNIGKVRDVEFKENGGLGLTVVREWGQSHFLVEKVTGQAAKLGVKVGEAVVSVNGDKVRWKNLSQLQDQLRKAGRPVTVQFAE